MEEIQKNLVIIDYQNDFVAMDGSLTCGEPAINIENNILNLIDEYKKTNIFITYDTHNEKDWEEDSKNNESKIFPMHCVYDTWGHELYGKLNDKLNDIDYTSIYKNSFATEKLAKNIILKNNHEKEILVQFCGVATNVCVFQNIILLYNYFVQNNINFKIIVDKKSVASFDAELEKQSLDYLKNTLNINII